jgi:phenylpropionate dioxygenase-like ring-hydroxylating dioxygenase large terminal subunit
MVERELWHPVIAVDALPLGAPLAVRLLGDDIVLWRDVHGAPHAWADRCPHRGTKLSLGRLLPDGSGLECPYHGWQFDRSGQCVVIPALPAFKPPPTHHACAFEAREAYGLLWARMSTGAANAPLPSFAAEDDASLRKLTGGPYVVEASAPRIVENFLDMAHFGFVHEGWLGDRAHASVADYVIEPTATGFVATDCSAWQPRANRLAEEGSIVRYRYELVSPFSAVLTKLPEVQGGAQDEIALFVLPQEPERSVVWFRFATADHTSSDAELRAFQETIFGQDKPILESQSPKRLPLSGGEVHCAADRASAAYRRFLIDRHITFGTC